MKTPNARIARLKELIVLEEKRAQLQRQVASVNERIALLQGTFSSANLNLAQTVEPQPSLKPRTRIRKLRHRTVSLPKTRAGGAPIKRAMQITAAARLSSKAATLTKESGPMFKRLKSKQIQKRVPLKRGELKARILGELKRAGDSGVSIGELSGRLNSKYKNLYIWFLTTGKRIAGIKKAGPARYKLEMA